LAHTFLVLGELQSDPTNPEAGAPFTLRMSLRPSTGGGPLEGANVLAEFRPQWAEEAAPVQADFVEVAPGDYQAQARLPSEGNWTLRLRDRTLPEEEVEAKLTLAVGGSGNPEEFAFVFPPTGQQSPLWVWLLWLIGIPLIAGLTVTMLTTAGSRRRKPKERKH
jgi:hypothetical protein